MESTGEPSAKRPREDETAMTASRMAGGSGDGGQMGGVKKETPVTIPPSITHGFQNTHTTIVPYLNYFSVRNLNYSATNTSLRIRMNTPGSRPESYSAVVANATATGFSETLKSIDSDTVVSNLPIFPGPVIPMEDQHGDIGKYGKKSTKCTRSSKSITNSPSIIRDPEVITVLLSLLRKNPLHPETMAKTQPSWEETCTNIWDWNITNDTVWDQVPPMEVMQEDIRLSKEPTGQENSNAMSSMTLMSKHGSKQMQPVI